MFPASSLNDPGYADWRDAEAAVFSVMERLRRGQMPCLEGASPAALRRLGYLAEMTLLFLDAGNREALKRLVDGIKGRLAGETGGEPLPAVPCGTRQGRGGRGDEVGAAWNIAPGISLARYKAEAPALMIG